MYQSDVIFYYVVVPNTVHHIEGYGALIVKSYTYEDLVVYLDVIGYDTKIHSSRISDSALDRVEELRLASQENINHLQYELAPFLADKFVRFEEKTDSYMQN